MEREEGRGEGEEPAAGSSKGIKSVEEKDQVTKMVGYIGKSS